MCYEERKSIFAVEIKGIRVNHITPFLKYANDFDEN